MTLVLIGKGFVLGGLTLKNRGHRGSRYMICNMYVYFFYIHRYTYIIHIYIYTYLHIYIIYNLDIEIQISRVIPSQNPTVQYNNRSWMEGPKSWSGAKKPAKTN